MRWCENKFKVKIAHFPLPSASHKRACLSTLEETDNWDFAISLGLSTFHFIFLCALEY